MLQLPGEDFRTLLARRHQSRGYTNRVPPAVHRGDQLLRWETDWHVLRADCEGGKSVRRRCLVFDDADFVQKHTHKAWIIESQGRCGGADIARHPNLGRSLS